MRGSGIIFGAPGEITRAAPSPLRGRRHFATTLSRAVYGARLELPTAWFVVFHLKPHISLYLFAFIRLTLSNKISLFGHICLYLGLFGAIYWTASSASHTQSFLIQAASSIRMLLPNALAARSRVKSVTETFQDRAVAQGQIDWSSSA